MVGKRIVPSSTSAWPTAQDSFP